MLPSRVVHKVLDVRLRRLPRIDNTGWLRRLQRARPHVDVIAFVLGVVANRISEGNDAVANVLLAAPMAETASTAHSFELFECHTSLLDVLHYPSPIIR